MRRHKICEGCGGRIWWGGVERKTKRTEVSWRPTIWLDFHRCCALSHERRQSEQGCEIVPDMQVGKDGSIESVWWWVLFVVAVFGVDAYFRWFP